jgi:hypothetical protein
VYQPSQYVVLLAERLPESAVSELVARTGGNPFFVTEVARLVVAHGPRAVAAVPAACGRCCSKARLS